MSAMNQGKVLVAGSSRRPAKAARTLWESQLLDTAIAAQYRIVGIPIHYFMDTAGILREWRIGSMSLKTMNKLVDEITPASEEVPGP